MIRPCTSCKTKFEIKDEDLEFYQEVSPEFNGVRYTIPPPTFCPACRFRRRLTCYDPE